MTLQDAIKQMMDFYRAVEAVSSKKVEGALMEASDAMEELEKMQTLGVNCDHCKYDGSGANTCKECMLYWLATIDQKLPLHYEPF